MRPLRVGHVARHSDPRTDRARCSLRGLTPGLISSQERSVEVTYRLRCGKFSSRGRIDAALRIAAFSRSSVLRRRVGEGLTLIVSD